MARRKYIVILMALIFMHGCTPASRGASTAAGNANATNAAIALVTLPLRIVGAAVGAAIGAAAGMGYAAGDAIHRS